MPPSYIGHTPKKCVAVAPSTLQGRKIIIRLVGRRSKKPLAECTFFVHGITIREKTCAAAHNVRGGGRRAYRTKKVYIDRQSSVVNLGR